MSSAFRPPTTGRDGIDPDRGLAKAVSDVEGHPRAGQGRPASNNSGPLRTLGTQARPGPDPVREIAARGPGCKRFASARVCSPVDVSFHLPAAGDHHPPTTPSPNASRTTVREVSFLSCPHHIPRGASRP